MPKINVYLPDALASAVKDAGVPVSAVCQAALSDAVERVGRTRRGIAALRDPATPAATLQQIGDGTRKRMTPRLVAALGVAGLDLDGQARTAVSSLDLLRGLLDDGENLAVRLLLAQGVNVDALAEATRASETGEPEPPVPESSDTLLGDVRIRKPAMTSGGRGIRTPGGLHPKAFQEPRIRPLCHPSERLTLPLGGLAAGARWRTEVLPDAGHR